VFRGDAVLAAPHNKSNGVKGNMAAMTSVGMTDFVATYTTEFAYWAKYGGCDASMKTAVDPKTFAMGTDGATIKLGMRNNALVFDRSFLDTPMALAHSGLKSAFELHAEQMLGILLRAETFGSQVRKLLVKHIATDDIDVPAIARRMGMSVQALRRRLANEGTSHSKLLASVRSELANHYLTDRQLPIAEVAVLLGFAHVPAFYKAFARWTQGRTPAVVRREARRR
jgi:AraC-like DNA-binding protein